MAYPLKPTYEAKNGIGYRAANGGKILGEGMKGLVLEDEHGQMLKMECKVGQISKALRSVKEMCNEGDRVVFDDDGSYIINKKIGVKTIAHKKNNSYVLSVKVVPRHIANGIGLRQQEEQQKSKLNSLQGFSRLAPKL